MRDLLFIWYYHATHSAAVNTIAIGLVTVVLILCLKCQFTDPGTEEVKFSIFRSLASDAG